MGMTSLNNKNRIPINSIPDKWPNPQTRPIFQPFLCDEMARGVTAARWSGPEITWSIEARIAEKSVVIKRIKSVKI